MNDAILTLSLSAAAGVVLVVAAQRLMLPAIVLLLAGGIVLGPEVFGLILPDALGHGLEIVAALTIAVILFEGGLTLDFEGYRKSSVVIRRMLTIGPLITWFGTSTVVYFLWDTEPVMALMVASMIIVTGPHGGVADSSPAAGKRNGSITCCTGRACSSMLSGSLSR